MEILELISEVDKFLKEAIDSNSPYAPKDKDGNPIPPPGKPLPVIDPKVPEPTQQQEPTPDPNLPTKDITKEEAKALIKGTKGKFFTVTFIKKDGTTRVMNARLGVRAYLKGGELPYDPEEKGLIPVFDVQIKRYRMVNTQTIIEIKLGNIIYKVK